jgi:hypothetical protein
MIPKIHPLGGTPRAAHTGVNSSGSIVDRLRNQRQFPKWNEDGDKRQLRVANSCVIKHRALSSAYANIQREMFCNSSVIKHDGGGGPLRRPFLIGTALLST